MNNCDKHIKCFAWYMPHVTKFCIPYTESIASLVNYVRLDAHKTKMVIFFTALFYFFCFSYSWFKYHFFEKFFFTAFFFISSTSALFFSFTGVSVYMFDFLFFSVITFLSRWSLWERLYCFWMFLSWMIELEVDAPRSFGLITIQANGDGTFSLISTGLGNFFNKGSLN